MMMSSLLLRIPTLYAVEGEASSGFGYGERRRWERMEGYESKLTCYLHLG